VSLRVTIELAGAPRGKGRPRAVIRRSKAGAVHPGVYTDGKTRTYEAQLRYAAQQEMTGRPPTALPVRVTVEARFPVSASWSKRKQRAALAGEARPCTVPDWENIAKLLDALNGVVWLDDRQVVDGTIRKIYAEAPSLVVTVETIEPPAIPPASRNPSLPDSLPDDWMERDAADSYTEAIAALRERHKAGEPLPDLFQPRNGSGR
jgi:Holliday junction resolvase RusA-like endonuclease